MYGLKSGWGAILGYHLGIVLLLSTTGGWPRIKRLWTGWHTALGLTLVLICALSGLVIYLLWPLIQLDGIHLGQALNEYGLTGNAWVGFVVYYAFVNPWLEELFWRGHFASRIRYPAIGDLFFAGYHVLVLILFVTWVWAVLAFLVLFVTARLWRYCVNQTNGLLIPALSHLIADISVITAIAILAL